MARRDTVMKKPKDTRGALRRILRYLGPWRWVIAGVAVLSLLSNLLEFSSLEQGKLQVEKSAFHVRTLCDETASMFEPIAHKKNLVFDYRNELRPNLYANSDRLKIK